MYDVKRDDQLRKWINEGPEGFTPTYEGVIMWGVWFGVAPVANQPPAALFGTRGEAEAFAAPLRVAEWGISPCIVNLKTRDDFEIPAPEDES